MTQNVIVIGDLHFGTRNNSLTWLKHQVQGFREVIHYIKSSIEEYEDTVVIQMGDVFDSRHSINPIIYDSVSNLLLELDDVLETTGSVYHTRHAYFLAGNHDYYHPRESVRNITSMDMLHNYRHIDFITHRWEQVGPFLLIPWFSFHNPDTLGDILERSPEQDTIFTHTDPFHMNPIIRQLTSGYNIVTGHIHQPSQDTNLLITGAMYPLDFNDRDSRRGFWTIRRYGTCKPVVEFHDVVSSIHFHTIHEEQLLKWESIGIQPDDYVEVRIHPAAVDEYFEMLKILNEKFNTNISYIREQSDMVTEELDVLDVDSVCRKYIPEHLKSTYQKMIDAYNTRG